MKKRIISLAIISLLGGCNSQPTYLVLNRKTDALNADIVYSTQNLDEAVRQAENLFADDSSAFTAVGISPCRREGNPYDYLYVCSEIVYRRSK